MSQYFRVFRSYLLLTCLLPILLAVILFTAGTLWLKASLPFRARGIEKLAVVKEINPRPNNSAELSYYYWDENSKAHEFRAVVPSQWKLFADNNRQVSITYLPEDPEKHMIGGLRDLEKEAGPGEYMRMAAVLLVLGALASFVFVYIKLRRIVEVIHKGVGISTVVSEWVKDSNSRLKPNQIKYHFNGTDGRWYEGCTLAVPEEIMRKYPVGSRIMVCFDPADPSFHQADVFSLRKKTSKT